MSICKKIAYILKIIVGIIKKELSRSIRTMSVLFKHGKRTLTKNMAIKMYEMSEYSTNMYRFAIEDGEGTNLRSHFWQFVPQEHVLFILYIHCIFI